MLSLPLYVQGTHNREFQRNLHTVGSCSIAVRMFTRHTLDVQPPGLKRENVHHTEGINVKGVAVCLVLTTLIWHQRYSRLWHRAVWQICTDISEYLPPPSSRWWRQQVPLRWCYISTSLHRLDQGDEQHHYHHLENLRSQFIWHSTSPWNLDQNLIDMRL